SGRLRDFALKNNGDLREEIGWNDMLQAITQVRDSLPAEQRANVGIVVGNYGEGGAVEILGPAYHLPGPISLTNSAWLRGYPSPPPSTLIVVGWSRSEVDEAFTGCVLNTQYINQERVENEESRDHRDIFVCGPPHKPWLEFWKDSQRFG